MKRTIAIVRRNGLGDFIAGAIPLYNCMLEENKENYEFHFFLSTMNYHLFKYFANESKDKMVVFDSGNKYFSIVSMAYKYRRMFDKGYLTMPDYPKLTGLFLFLMGTKEIFGYINDSILARVTINKGIKNADAYTENSKHIGLLSIQLYDSKIQKIEKRWYPKFNQSKIKTFDINIKGPFLMVELSNNRQSSQLSIEKICKIIRKLRAQQVFTVLITAKSKDESKANFLRDILTENDLDIFIYITNDLDSYISYINKADVLLVGDGGLGHISGALNKYVVALYGGTSVERWGILSDKAIILYDKRNVNNISDDIIINELNYCFDSLKKC